MNILVFEFATSGGIGGCQDDASWVADLWQEGETMRRLLTEDLAQAGHEVFPFLAPSHPLIRQVPAPASAFQPDAVLHRAAAGELPGELAAERGLEALRQAARRADGVLLIAPECGGVLARLAREIERLGVPLFSPSSELIELAADKHRLASRLAQAGVPVPPGIRVEPGDALAWDAPLPWVLKPLDGAGSMEVLRLDNPPNHPAAKAGRLERYCPGLAASVAALGNSSDWLLLEPCEQQLRDRVHFEYLGGRLPLPEPLRLRARKLAQLALQGLPHTRGYVGIDMVLGTPADGSEDYVLEVNPRLTTSYAGLRQAAAGNLAGWMLDAARGGTPPIRFSRSPLAFGTDGSVVHGPSAPFLNPHEYSVEEPLP